MVNPGTLKATTKKLDSCEGKLEKAIVKKKAGLMESSFFHSSKDAEDHTVYSPKAKATRILFFSVVIAIWIWLGSSNQQLSYIIIGYLFKNPFVVPDLWRVSSGDILTVPLKLMSAISEK